VVYRALAGLDSIAQAAGRCNREGLLALGKVILFIPPKPSPAGHLRQAEECARILLQEDNIDHLSPERFTKFFQNLYWLKGKNLDRHKILDDLQPNHELGIYFKRAAANFKIIDDSAYLPLSVRYGESPKVREMLRQKKDKQAVERYLLRKLQRFTINIHKSVHNKLATNGEIVEINSEVFPGLFVQKTEIYSEKVGLLIPDLLSYRSEELIG
ncbi:MAG: CRISPR-associated helicase/endonuclease Cas3, partial [Blastocatellia bacterium]|nr:CRISPR-associated helicase/endonuclease Cas3 [Blastocatellia bacterium]